MENTTITPAVNKSEVPWYRKIGKEKQATIRYVKKHGINKVLTEELAPLAIATIGEIIVNEDTPPQVRLQSCQLALNKVIGDKIEVKESKINLDVNKLLDQLISLKHISPIEDNQVIDITEDKG